MNRLNHRLDQEQNGCMVLMDACTPMVYLLNAFRITGLPVDASTRDVKRRIDDLKHAEEIGASAEEYKHAFAIDPPPGLEHIREAAQRLQDPERRVVEEFFWFWPMEWGRGKEDPALLALASGDRKLPFRNWSEALSHNHAPAHVISKHNLAVMFHLLALDGENLAVDRNLSADSMARIDKYWRTCLKWWEELTVDERFWSIVTERIKILDDPRVTTGFARRLRAGLPEAMDKINGMLALQFAEKGKFDLVRKHTIYMKKTHQGLDDISKTLAIIIEPVQTRIYAAVDQANNIAQQNPEQAAQAARELFRNTAEPLQVIKNILPKENHARIDLCDAVAEAGVACQEAFAREIRDRNQCIEILRQAKIIAESAETLARIEENENFLKSASLVDLIFEACERAFAATEEDPTFGVKEGNHLISTVLPMLERLEESGASPDFRDRARDYVAGTLMHCAIAFGNKNEKWQPCIPILESSLMVVVNPELRERISKNLQIARQNEQGFGNLEPISSAPSLFTIYGIGLALYGSSDKDLETGSYLSTYFFVFLWIPIFPICRYRIIHIDNGYRFLGKAPLSRFDKWHLAISVTLIVLLTLYFLMAGDSSAVRPSHSSRPNTPTVISSPSSSYGTQPSSRIALREEIENDKKRAKLMETQIDELDRRLDDYERRMNSCNASDMVDEYNSLVRIFNSLVNQRNQVYKEYNALIDDVNVKVRRYNTTYR